MSTFSASSLPSWAQVPCAFFAVVQSGKPIGKNILIASIIADIEGKRWGPQITKLRELSDAIDNAQSPAEREAAEKEYDRLKRKLAAFMVSAATADGRHNGQSAKDHTGLLQLDVDNLPTRQAATETRDRWRSDPYICCAFLSPGGRGVKAFIRVPADISGHGRAWQAVSASILAEYRQHIDDKPKSPASVCFVSADPDLWCKEAEPFPVPEGGEIRQKKPTHTPTHPPVLLSSAHCETVPLDSGPCTSGRCALDAVPLGTVPCVRFNARAIEAELKFREANPVLAKIESRLVGKFLPLVEGERNTILTCDITPPLFGAMSYSAAVRILEYYLAADLLGGYPPEEAREKFHAAWNGLRQSLPSALNLYEATAYAAMATGADSSVYLDGFRIARSLALLDVDDYPPPRFFLSSRDFAARLDLRSGAELSPRKAWDLLRTFVRWQILRPDSRGGARGSGDELAGRAAEFTWLL